MSIKKSTISSESELVDLVQKLHDSKKELLNLRFQLASGELSNTSRFKEVKKDIARISTYLTQKKSGGQHA